MGSSAAAFVLAVTSRDDGRPFAGPRAQDEVIWVSAANEAAALPAGVAGSAVAAVCAAAGVRSAGALGFLTGVDCALAGGEPVVPSAAAGELFAASCGIAAGAPLAVGVVCERPADSLSSENISVEADPRVPLVVAEVAPAEVDLISSPTRHYSMSPGALRALVGFVLVAAILRALLFGAKALEHLSDRFGALRRSLPGQ